jgi:hypothetical protein
MPSVNFRFAFLLDCLDDEAGGASLWQNDTWQEHFNNVPLDFYPSHGLWPANDSDLPRGLTRTTSDAILNFLKALKVRKGDNQFESNRRDEYAMGRKEILRIFSVLFSRSKIKDRLGELIRDKGYHPLQLINCGLVSTVHPSHVH